MRPFLFSIIALGATAFRVHTSRTRTPPLPLHMASSSEGERDHGSLDALSIFDESGVISLDEMNVWPTLDGRKTSELGPSAFQMTGHGCRASRSQTGRKTIRLPFEKFGKSSWGSRLPGDHFIKDLLTLRAAQSMNYYALEFHDETSVTWLEKFINVTDVHSVGSTQFMYRLMKTEPESIKIKKLRQMPKGGSRNNPYLKNSNSVAIEYDVLIDPMNIAKRLMAVRSQIASEWAADLQRIEDDNAEISRYYEASTRFGDKSRMLVYDSDNPFASSSSPYRAKNYIDLRNLLTKQGISSTIEYLRDSRQTAVANWMERFMAKHEGKRGNELLEALLRESYVMLPMRNGKLRAIEPDKLGLLVMEQRSEHAQKWIEECSVIDEDHVKVNAMMLEFQFRSGSEDVAAALAEQLRTQYKERRDRDRENLLSGAATWWEQHFEDLDLEVDEN